MISIKKTRKNKHWWGYRGKEPFRHYWWECKLVQPLWNSLPGPSRQGSPACKEGCYSCNSHSLRVSLPESHMRVPDCPSPNPPDVSCIWQVLKKWVWPELHLRKWILCAHGRCPLTLRISQKALFSSTWWMARHLRPRLLPFCFYEQLVARSSLPALCKTQHFLSSMLC